MDPFVNPLHICDDAYRMEQTRDVGDDAAGLDDYPHTDHPGVGAAGTKLSVIEQHCVS